MYKINEFAKQLSVRTDTVRYYEKIGLVQKPKRSLNGYRVYSEQDVHTFKFILRCKEFGFTLKEIKPILNYVRHNKSTKKLKIQLDSKIEEIEEKQKELRVLKKQLKMIKESCIQEDCSLLDYI